ncbi:succinate dehydrogenase / fumarate reductase membrane anchor subunit [Povalibacter uvarum]|jgi:succinate dehydrogenase / fumarate reductase membrane anchor subunit|uniref:Succinate dehydrogenase hydrophobic membrane anchor subunit n=1 Tax=Povalibacter uvarum TaxID=732238 RepID=A0A841HHJ5_9GAMM|nr:succinate dehydrogenase, hydrophobic membrane anchor protein [Povalibacter uvarum]MBB6091790.1 succinate dehydrogenase / fumarate reductase membrane anchor subunit [Povalibacter uvarum]
MSLRSPIGRVLGLGSAKEGVSHWWSQRVTAVALVLLTLWFASALLRLGDFSHAAVIAWIAMPFNAVLLSLLIGTALYHSQLGVQVVVEDYVVGHGLKVVTLLLLNFLHIALAALGIFSVLRIAFGAAP